MKILAISQRVEINKEYMEIRDSLDQRWISVINKLDFITIPMPNMDSPSTFIETIKPSAIILSGGNTITKVDNTDIQSSIERDKYEEKILSIALEKGIPILGVCRGMQMINLFFNGSATATEEHIGVEHNIDFVGKYSHMNSRLVNSYHKWSIKESNLGERLLPIAFGEDKTIEAFYHQDYPIYGIMWHPEREEPLNVDDINLLSHFLKK